MMSDPILAQPFNEQVYALVRHIPHGRVLTYGRVAALLENPRGARAVGWALHALPVASDVPWQRVINAAGQISTRSQDHDAVKQRERLLAEGIEFSETDAFKVLHFTKLLWTPSPWEVRDLLSHAESKK